MKYVLRNLTTGRYLKRAGEWVLGVDEAMSFDDASEAREFSQAYHLEDVQPVKLLAPYLLSLLTVAPGAGITGS